MLGQCPFLSCLAESNRPDFGRLVRNGFFYRRSDSTWVARYRCKSCGRSPSAARRSPCYRQKKRHLNRDVEKLLVSGVSQRRTARLLRLNPKTVVNKFRFLACQARKDHSAWIRGLESSQRRFEDVQFDELETIEQSKCLPVSIALAVSHPERKILGYQVSSMPAKGLLAPIALKKYGKRRDDRTKGLRALFRSIRPLLAPNARLLSDECPRYPDPLQREIPRAIHLTVRSRRGCVAGQGELKKIGCDPLFSLNHTCAMFRANVNRLFRRTWCTTKVMARLDDHLALYVRYHNQVLTQPLS